MGAIHFPEPFQANQIPQQLKEMWVDQVYAQYFIGRKDLVIYDIGANIGLFSMLVHQFAKVIYAVEPVKENYEYLLKNIEANNLTRVKPAMLAVTNDGRDVELNIVPGHKTAHNILMNVAGVDNKELCKSVSLDELIKEPADFIKLDVEGAEYEIICGENFKKAAPRIKILFGETHEWARRTDSQLMWALKECGFDVRFFKADANLFVARRDV